MVKSKGKIDITSMESWKEFETTEQIKIPKKLVDQVIGQDRGVDIIKKAAKQRRNVLLIGVPGTGKCVGPDTPITLNDEIVKAEELFSRINENGWNSELRTFAIDSSDLRVKSRKITHIAKFKAPSSMFRLKTGLGQSITLTGNHPVLTIKKNGKMEWASVRDLNEKDWIGCVRAVPFIEENKNMANQTSIRYKTSPRDYSSKPIQVPRELDDSVARFLAYFVSETSITRNRNIILTNREKDVVEDFANLAKKLFNVRFKIAKRKDKEVYYAQASSSSLCRFMNEFFDVPLTIPKRSREMPFPHQLLNVPLPTLSEFLRTLFDMEGHIQKDRRKCIEISSASSELIRGVQVALLRYGIISKIKERISSATNSREPKRRTYYYLYIQGTKNLRLFADNIDFDIEDKKKRLQKSIESPSNPNLDIVPNISKDLEFLKNMLEFKNTEVTKYPFTFSRYIYNKRAPSRESLSRVVEKISEAYIEKSKNGFYNEDIEDSILKLHYLSESDIYWDKVISIEKVGDIDFVYDFTVEGFHNFLAGNVLLHNSMLALAMTELLPCKDLVDILAYPNMEDENNPKIKAVPAGEGIKMVKDEREKSGATEEPHKGRLILPFIIILGTLALSIMQLIDPLVAVSLIGFGILLFFLFGLNLRVMMMGGQKSNIPRLIVDNATRKAAPFFDGTGAHAGALLGDIKHDPLQCLPGDEIVHLPNGKPIEISRLVDPIMKESTGSLRLTNDKKLEILAGFDNRYCYTSSRVCNVFKRRYNGELIEISGRRGYKIRVTPNHPVAVLNDDGYVEYIEAKKIRHGMPLIVPEKLPINATEALDNNFIELLAYILADGCISDRFVSFKLRRKFKIDEIAKCIKKNGLKARINEYKGSTLININSIDFVRKLLGIGAKENGQKRIPSLIYDQPLDKIKIFIAKYLSLDGYVTKQGQFELMSKELTPCFIPLLLKVGIRPSLKQRKYPGFGKDKIQNIIYFSDYYFAKEYFENTINPIHRRNLKEYLGETRSGHVTFNDVIPLSFKTLETIRFKTGLSQNKAHKAYYSIKKGLKTSHVLTRGFLQKIICRFLTHTNCPELFRIKNLADGTYAYDEVTSLDRIKYSGYVYNLTTEAGNYLVNNTLTHNSGGLGTPAHLRVVSGLIHKANKGVLFIDEVSSLGRSQQDLLTAMQEKQLSITGRSEMSSGAMVITDPVPTDFILIAAGNFSDIQHMHPALRSRIRGYGYEVYMDDMIDDSEEYRKKLVQFIAQEVDKDGKIPHFSRDAVGEIIREARRKAGMKNKITLKFREVGGLIRASGDIAREKGHRYVTADDVMDGKNVARTLEHQLGDLYLDRKKEYNILITEGGRIGRVNGLAVLGEGGTVLPIEAEVAPGGKKSEIIATGKLGDIAKEAIQNVSGVIMKIYGEDIKEKYDIFVQFLQTYEGVEGDSASVSVAVAMISAFKDIPVDQSVAMTGSLTVRGEVLPVGGVTQKIEAAIEAGLKRAIIPKSNEEDVLLEKRYKGKIEIVTAETIVDVLKHSLIGGEKIIRDMGKYSFRK